MKRERIRLDLDQLDPAMRSKPPIEQGMDVPGDGIDPP
jgi:hypothetical protein